MHTCCQSDVYVHHTAHLHVKKKRHIVDTRGTYSPDKCFPGEVREFREDLSKHFLLESHVVLDRRRQPATVGRSVNWDLLFA